MTQEKGRLYYNGIDLGEVEIVFVKRYIDGPIGTHYEIGIDAKEDCNEGHDGISDEVVS